MKDHHYSRHAVVLRAELGAAVSREQMRELHRKAAWRHLIVAARQFAILALTTWALIKFENPLIWIPLAIVQGFTIFNFTVLLHEVVHHTIFEKRHPVAERILGLLYAIPSGISASQFTRWHLDHHAELGSDTDDPKRAHLSPKRNARWYKLLYCTPALFPIYFRAARIESATYPADLQQRIAFERRISILFHLSALAAIWYVFGFYAALRTSIIPVFFVFPVAFTLNRLGQHYDIDPTDPAKWGTLMRGNWFWDFVFLNSNYHLEHHYFPGVPFYRLPQLQKALLPFYEKKQMRWRTYGELVYGWIVENQQPHTDWAATKASRDAGVAPHISFH
ncbi:MAG TPA: fatty acid desaturase [Vicinamibacterales bacterium]